MKRTIAISAAGTLLLALSAPALAQEEMDVSETEAEAARLNLGLGAGVIFPQVQSELKTTGGLQMTAGWRVWKRLVPYFGLGYHQPRTETFQMDPRLDGNYRSDTTQRELTLSLGGFWRLLPADARLNGYGGLALRAWFLETKTNGWSGGEMFLENEETSTRYGAAAFVGGEFKVGPGSATLELDFGGSDLPHLVTGDVATTSLSIFAGYRLLLL